MSDRRRFTEIGDLTITSPSNGGHRSLQDQVFPLKWKESGNGEWQAKSAGHIYEIVDDGRGGEKDFSLEFIDYGILYATLHSSFEEAAAHAAKEHESRIRSALRKV